MLRRIAFAALAFFMLVPLATARVVFLSTERVTAAAPGFPNTDDVIINNAYNAFQTSAGASGIVDRRDVLTTGSVSPKDFTAGDVVVVMTVYKTMTPANSSAISNLMQSRPDLSFLIFSDGCCERAANLSPLVAAVSQGFQGATLGTVDGPAYNPAIPTSDDISSPLNTGSPYSTGFPNLIQGEAFQLVTNVPNAYALYLDNGATPAAPATMAPTNAYGMLIPQQRFAGAAGSCVFLMADTSPFAKLWPDTQSGPIANAFYNAAAASSGACKMAPAEPDLTPTLAGPATAVVGAPQTFTLPVNNNGSTASTDGTATVALPAGMTITTPPAGCTFTSPVLQCPLAAIAPGGNQVIAFQATATQTGSFGLQSAISGVTHEINTANNNAAGNAAANLTVAAVASAGGGAHAVPTVSWEALLLMSLLVPWVAKRRRRRD